MSEQELLELLEQLRAGMDTTPLHTGDLPPLDLYMDQVLAMLEERFQSGARQPGEKTITKTIINNYSKARLLQKPVGKKYTPEHLLVITLILFVLFYIWAFGFLMYQNWAVQYVATDTASRIAQTYGYSSSDPITGYISHAARVSLSPYRYKDDEEEKIQDVNANRAEKYARYSLKEAGFAKEKGLDIEVTTVKDALASSHVEVKVTAQYEIPFGFAMKYFGQSPYRKFTATGRAVCLDIQHYIYTNKSLDAMEDAIGAGVSSSVIKTAEKVISIIRSGFKALKKS